MSPLFYIIKVASSEKILLILNLISRMLLKIELFFAIKSSISQAHFMILFYDFIIYF